MRGSPLAAFSYATSADRLLLGVAVTCSVLQGSTPAVSIYLVGSVINSFGQGELGEEVTQAAMMFLVLGSVSFVFGTVAHTLFEMCAERQVASIKKSYVRAILRQNIGYYDLKDPGTLCSDIEQTCLQIRDAIGLKFAMGVQFTVQFFAGYVVGLIVHWKLALILLIGLPLIAFNAYVLTIAISRAVQTSTEAYSRAGSLVEEILPNIRTVAAFGLEGHFRSLYSNRVKEAEAADRAANVYKSICLGAIMLILILVYALGWYVGTGFVLRRLRNSDGEDLSMGGRVLTVFFACMGSAFALGQIAPNINALSQAAGAIETIDQLMTKSSLADPFSDAGKMDVDFQGRIEFRDVAFAYPTRPNRPIYQNLSLIIEPGEKIALVGGSGSGKSTVIQLLQRFYDVDRGSILIDGLDIRSYNIRFLRSQMALVAQEPRLFSLTVEENIRLGAKDLLAIDDEQIQSAARAANANTFIEQMPRGYKTHVGEGGSSLSGGQKQRVAIARALLRNPKIMLLDEATSALDNESERSVQVALDKMLNSRCMTCIIVAHRLSTIRNADRIIVLGDNNEHEGSSIVESGTHEELMRIDNGKYRSLVESQQTFTTRSSEIPSPPPVMSSTSICPSTNDIDVRKESVLTPTKRPEGATAKPRKQNSVRRLWEHCRKDWMWAVLGTLGSFGAGFCIPALTVMTSQFVDVFYDIDDEQPLVSVMDGIRSRGGTLAIALACLGVIAAVVWFLQQFAWGTLGERLVSQLRRDVFNQLIYQDIEYFDDPNTSTGHLASVLATDCALTRGITGENLSLFAQNAFQLIIAIVIAFWGHARLAAVSCLIYLLIIPATFVQVRMTQPEQPKGFTFPSDDQENQPKLNTKFLINEMITNLKTIAAFNMQETLETLYHEAVHAEYRRKRRNALITGAASGVANGLQPIAHACAFLYARKILLENDDVGVGTIIRTQEVIMGAAMGIGRASAFLTDQRKARAACANIFEIIDRQPKIDVRDEAGDRSTEIQGNLSFDKVSFRYPSRPDAPVLKDVSFQVQAGESMALVGTSGSGKSTIVQLLERFYDLNSKDACIILGEEDREDLSSGVIRLDSKRLNSYHLSYLRSRIGLVSQEPVLFTGSIRDNIRLGKLDASDEEIFEAARQANAYDFVMDQPEGFATHVGWGGAHLSGGQKQRIAIARALIRKPALLLFDEATSALDAESEAVVQTTLNELIAQRNTTTITVAHRLSTIRTADRIVVFASSSKGSVVTESGQHHYLMGLEGGTYRKLVELARS